jgi:hypothetical protein
MVDVPTAARPTLVAAAERVELLTRLRVFTGWAGAGRKLTATGNLTMAAGRELIGLLGTDDRLDERIGDQVFKTRSTVELPGVDFTFRLARHAGFVKVRTGTVSTTKRGTQLGRDPLGDRLAAVRDCSTSASCNTATPAPPGSTLTGRRPSMTRCRACSPTCWSPGSPSRSSTCRSGCGSWSRHRSSS